MILNNKKYVKLFYILLLSIVLITLINVFSSKYNQEKNKAEKPITINLLTNVHPNLPWSFKAINKSVVVTPGEVKTVDFFVENLKDIETSGIATFAYFPKEFGNYIRKLNCFCYDSQTLKANQGNKYSLIILIDPEVTKDSKTKNVKEITIQFTFFDYKDYKKINS